MSRNVEDEEQKPQATSNKLPQQNRSAPEFTRDDEEGNYSRGQQHIIWGDFELSSVSSEASSVFGDMEQPVASTVAHFAIEDIFTDSDRDSGDSPDDAQNIVPGIPLEEVLTAEEFRKLMAMVPLDDNGSETSLGSRQHNPMGYKKACFFVHSTMGCWNGILCEYCHFPHCRKNTTRPCKAKRGRHRKVMERRQVEFESSGELASRRPRCFRFCRSSLAPPSRTYEHVSAP